ncbi:pyruvate decarboxylase THI3 [Gloeophyllum trabeum ATCC 11539]|uniref:Pyruvate decarboxylase THI3 n=1 Tax=Gloeophyllum trabeum (strain ATCC 11539 / FP-39264 / Madison 617) TaxID=670483 RepID=S7Q4U8_GLOTA|nr:pyruvate decarboxylase THI3 [Gloeophyllum trabeum ATCC 11539]EPQ54543.1 pyruvate decarboxylase THI3 [Gloeophyllum trabeum ATCC 11539]
MTSANVAELQAEVNRLRHELETVKVGQDTGDQIYVGSYLLERLAQLGVTSMFGVPGDFNLGFLDLVEDHKTIEWIGNCNELNAAYAADGYARVKDQSIGVVLTTFGVGELSAINGIAGAFSEHVPVLHIAGVPNTAQLKNKPMLHHTLGDGRFDAYTKAAELFTASQATLMNKSTAAAEIDRVLTDCIVLGRPVYLTLPTDICYEKIPSGRLRVPLSKEPPENDPDVENFVLDEIVRLLKDAGQDAIILTDACAIRHHVKEELKELLVKTHYPVFSAPMGKTTVNESYDRYGGIYVGSISHPDVKEKVESAKLVLSIGSLKSDFNTGNFTYSVPQSKTIELHSDHTMVLHARFPGIGMKRLLPKLTARLQPFKEEAKQQTVPLFKRVVPKEEDNIISQAWWWPRVGGFFKPKDIVVAETGTSSFGILDVPLPEGAVFVSQILWGSIGWTVGSTLGAALAGRELGLGRTILFVGDGSLQLTVQELSTMIRTGVKPIIFVLNNSGYTIERYLHGKYRKYNDIQNWKWTSLLDVLGGEGISLSYTVKTKEEAEKLLDDPEFASAKKIQLVEVIMPQHDAPRGLKAQAELSGKTNQYVADATSI